MRITLWATGALWLLPTLLNAQVSSFPTLADARAMARASRADLAAAQHAVSAAEGHLRQAGTLFGNPILFFGREQASRAGATNRQDIFAIEQPVEIGGQRAARRAEARAELEGAEARLASLVAHIDFELATSHAAVVTLTRRAALAEEAAEAFRRATRVSSARLESGDFSGYQHRRLSLEAARYMTLRLEATTARDSALQTLRAQIGATGSFALPTDVVSELVIPPPLNATPDSLVRLAWSQGHELRAARLDVQSSAAAAALIAADRIPTPTLSAGLMRERVATGEGFNGFVASVAFPLSLWDRRGGAVDAARSETAKREAEVEHLQQLTERDVRIAFAGHQSLHAQLMLLAPQLGQSAALARQAAEVAYAEGEIGLIEWLDMVRAYHEAETTYTSLWAELIARRAALERATGALLF